MMAREDPSNIKHVPDPSFPQGAAGGVYNGSKHCGSGRHLRCIISQGMPECVVQTCVRVCVCAHACACNVYSSAISGAPRQCLAMAKNMRMFLEGHTTLNKNVQVYSDPFSSDIHVTTQQSVCVNAEVSNVRLCLFLFRLAL